MLTPVFHAEIIIDTKKTKKNCTYKFLHYTSRKSTAAAIKTELGSLASLSHKKEGGSGLFQLAVGVPNRGSNRWIL